ncbi:hypothetical protein ACW0JT_05810 [Arthrobacter sp. SA17]
MTRDGTGDAPAFLRKIGLLAAILWIIGGIFGMHVISPAHSAQYQATTHQLAASHHDAAVPMLRQCTSIQQPRTWPAPRF